MVQSWKYLVQVHRNLEWNIIPKSLNTAHFQTYTWSLLGSRFSRSLFIASKLYFFIQRNVKVIWFTVIWQWFVGSPTYLLQNGNLMRLSKSQFSSMCHATLLPKFLYVNIFDSVLIGPLTATFCSPSSRHTIFDFSSPDLWRYMRKTCPMLLQKWVKWPVLWHLAHMVTRN